MSLPPIAPCWFCGCNRVAAVSHFAAPMSVRAFVECGGCGACGPANESLNIDCPDDREAINRWNTLHVSPVAEAAMKRYDDLERRLARIETLTDEEMDI